MSWEIFIGEPEELKARLDTLAPTTVELVTTLHRHNTYLIVYTA